MKPDNQPYGFRKIVGAGLSRDCFGAVRCDRGINPLLQKDHRFQHILKSIRRIVRIYAFLPLSFLGAYFASAVEKPNIVFVLVDDHAFEAVSAYGSYLKDYAKTPAIDSLGEEGMRFDNFVCANSICS